MDRQQDLFTDLPRGEQLAALRKLKLQPFVHNGRKVSPAIIKATLRAIDDHQGRGDCFATQATLAEEVGCGTTAIGLAIAALVAQDLITTDRPHRMAPNRHRVVWSSVFQKLRELPPAKPDSEPAKRVSNPAGQIASGTTDVEANPAGTVSSETIGVELKHDTRLQIAPSNAQRTAHLTAPWVAVAATMFRWGLKSATQACQAAADRGWSPEYAAELFREAGGDREPERWEPGQLANWLTGRTPPPFDEAEAIRRRTLREQPKIDADAIRDDARREGEARGVPQWATDGVTYARLEMAGLQRYATDDEREGYRLLAEHRRSKKTVPT